MMLVDSHCHLDFPDFRNDLDAVVGRAGEAGVGILVTICTRLSQLAETLAIIERFPQVYCAVGIHPHHVAEEGVTAVETLLEIAGHPKVVGIGETGLDYYYDRSPREMQQRSFRVHIEAARRAGLPFVVHARDADEDVAAILQDECSEGPVRGLLHCFSSGQQLADKALELGLYISASGIATFRAAEEIRAILRQVPSDRLLVETDAPFLAPVPKRGKRNEPAYVALTAAALAELKGLEPQAFARQTTENFLRLFSKVPQPDGLCG